MKKLNLEYATDLVHKITPSERPSWIINLLARLNESIALPSIHQRIISIGSSPESWHNGKFLFSEIRKQTLTSSKPLDEAIFCLLENSVKTIYNSSDQHILFDIDSPAWVLMNLNHISDLSELPTVRKLYEKTISELANI